MRLLIFSLAIFVGIGHFGIYPDTGGWLGIIMTWLFLGSFDYKELDKINKAANEQAD